MTLSILWDLLEYRRSQRDLADLGDEMASLFRKLVRASVEKRCLRVGYGPELDAQFGNNWARVDFGDRRSSDQAEGFSLTYGDSEFEVALCTGLQYVPCPDRVIREVYRVLKEGGEVWVQMPFCSPYRSAPREYWRASPQGMRVWMRDFDEILCAAYSPNRSALRSTTFFYGLKPHAEHVAVSLADFSRGRAGTSEPRARESL